MSTAEQSCLHGHGGLLDYMPPETLHAPASMEPMSSQGTGCLTLYLEEQQQERMQVNG